MEFKTYIFKEIYKLHSQLARNLHLPKIDTIKLTSKDVLAVS